MKARLGVRALLVVAMAAVAPSEVPPAAVAVPVAVSAPRDATDAEPGATKATASAATDPAPDDQGSTTPETTAESEVPYDPDSQPLVDAPHDPDTETAPNVAAAGSDAGTSPVVVVPDDDSA